MSDFRVHTEDLRAVANGSLTEAATTLSGIADGLAASARPVQSGVHFKYVSTHLVKLVDWLLDKLREFLQWVRSWIDVCVKAPSSWPDEPIEPPI